MVFALGTLCLAEASTDAANVKVFTEDMGFALAEKLRTAVFPFSDQLTEEEYALFYYMLSDHLQNLSYSDEWQPFESALDACTSLEDLRKILQEKFIGITEAEPGRLSREEIIPLAIEILNASKLSDTYPYRFYGPLHSYSPYAEAWSIYAKPHIKEATEKMLRLFLTANGKALWLDALNGSSCFELDREITTPEREKAEELAERFSLAFSAYEFSITDTVESSKHVYQAEGISESVTCVWILRGYYEDDGEAFGDILIIGIHSGTIYYFRSFVPRPDDLNAYLW